MSKLTEGTWVVVTDSEKALFLRNLTDHEDPYLEVIQTEEQDNPSDSQQTSDRPGRMSDAGPGHRSALSETDWHELQKERFADDLSEMLYKAAHAREFTRLILVASPQVLGLLRESLHKEVSDRIVMEIPKTLTNHPVSKIEKLVKNELECS